MAYRLPRKGQWEERGPLLLSACPWPGHEAGLDGSRCGCALRPKGAVWWDARDGESLYRQAFLVFGITMTPLEERNIPEHNIPLATHYAVGVHDLPVVTISAIGFTITAAGQRLAARTTGVIL